MGFSSTAGLTLLLTTVLICSIYMYSTVDLTSAKVNDAYNMHSEYLKNKLDEKITVVSVEHSSENMNITLLNEGQLTHELDNWDVLYNGTPVNFTITSGELYLAPLESVNISVNASSPGRISVVSEYGNQYYYNLN
ncbi:flagellar protein F [Methanococcus maripaludis]|uniref:Flagellar protein F n=3 Tax=Methanococcus maripaludis TaxID=39152 RepID=A0A7J9RYZ5_METMI|nr:flagellar protein F [Methanococcus maripaludis]MBA2849924.1 flagellar protein FlaF [Methanococcus maripaludis]MBB6067425.1 flagellar protein FlaF [Methanococcus maripaludis]MBG0769268.1 flagellar protein F [Methanococcus maripaludis]MBM7409714.1 flagellar protein FlaF [Methanococcus maripaludis]MBP2219534.1 flagellar protein FlaF [Methanococcus maripaludis]